jgi:hypothetical protein
MTHFLVKLTGISAEALPPVLGFAGASMSTLAVWIASTSNQITPEAQGWVQLGGTIGLITFLLYACRTLWAALQNARDATTSAQLAATEAATGAARAVAEALRESEARQAIERAAFIKAQAALEREIRGDWKSQNEALIAVLNRLDPDTP